MSARAALVVVALAACHDAGPPAVHDGAELVQELRRGELADWLVPTPAWQRTIMAPFMPLYADYAETFRQRMPLIAERIGHGELVARRHFAGDPHLDGDEARTRFMLPVQFPSYVVAADGRDLGAVFFHDGEHWRALTGLGDRVVERARVLDPACADMLANAGPRGPCTDMGYEIAAAVMRGDRPRFDRVCKLAAMVCGNASP